MKDLNLALWGPSAAGKTALLAQLYIRSQALRGDWEIYPTPESLPFIERMRPLLLSGNLFPPATPVGTPERIVYRFRHRPTGAVASLHVEDRAGKESEELDDAGRERLAAADGLVLLFDPIPNEAELREQVIRTLERLHVAGNPGDKDPRPIAICLSKADSAVHTLDDARRVHESPDDFVRERMAPQLAGWIELFCANFRLFPVSAAGVRVRRGVVEPVVFYDEQLRFRIGQDGEPINLLEPFLWIFEQVEGRV